MIKQDLDLIVCLQKAHQHLLLAYANINPTRLEAEIINSSMRKCGDALSRLCFSQRTELSDIKIDTNLGLISHLKEAHKFLLLAYADISPTKFESEIVNSSMRKCSDALAKLDSNQQPTSVREKRRIDNVFPCPKCNSETITTISAKASPDKNIRRRNKKCVKCDYEFKTYESIERPAELHQGVASKIDKVNFMNIVKQSTSLQDVANKYGVTRERVRQIAVSLGVDQEIKSIFKQNRE